MGQTGPCGGLVWSLGAMSDPWFSAPLSHQIMLKEVRSMKTWATEFGWAQPHRTLERPRDELEWRLWSGPSRPASASLLHLWLWEINTWKHPRGADAVGCKDHTNSRLGRHQSPCACRRQTSPYFWTLCCNQLSNQPATGQGLWKLDL